MQKIVPHLWFNTEAKEASSFYVSLFPNSEILNQSVIQGTPSGDCDIISFKLADYSFMAISAGPYFTFNPSISISVQCESEEEICALYAALSKDGKELMPLNNYGFSKKFGWINDRYGLSWQLNLPNDYGAVKQKIAPFLLFTKEQCGKAEEAMEYYTSLFENAHIEHIIHHGAGKQEKEGSVQHGVFILEGQEFMAMDSALEHNFTFNEAISLIVNCKTQEEIDYFWEKLSAVPEAEQCGWLKDKYGVSWQIVPTQMDEMMRNGTPEQITRVTKAFLQMKKFVIADLQKAYEG